LSHGDLRQKVKQRPSRLLGHNASFMRKPSASRLSGTFRGRMRTETVPHIVRSSPLMQTGLHYRFILQ